MPENVKLSAADLQKLLADPTPSARAETATKVAGSLSAQLTDRERALATDIIRLMVRDAAVVVRKALSDSLKDDPSIPADVARSLALDVDEVALPIIEHSLALNDEVLLEIIGKSGPERQIAVARRAHVSAIVSDALAETHNIEVVATLMANDGAQLTDRTLMKVLDEFGNDPRVNEPMATRSKLPILVAERLVSVVSERLRDHLVTHHEMSPDTAADLLLESRERATLQLVATGRRLDLAQLVEQLNANGRLTPTLILRALCMGDIGFFENAMARLAGISVPNAYRLIHDQGGRGLEQLYLKCGMPPKLLPIVRAAIDVADETELGQSEDDRERFRHRMIERVLTSFEEGFDADNLDYFVTRLARPEATAEVA